MYDYIEKFKKLGFGLFVHFGLYSIIGKGEWAYCIHHLNPTKYQLLTKKLNPSKNWAKNLVKTAKKSGCKYITLTTRHHDGFSLYDTCGLNDYDAPHSKCGRDLIKEFVDACNEENIIPFFYHTLLDWYSEDFENDFSKYIDYLANSVEILCKNYGKIGGFWFDGKWSKPNNDWQEDRIYGIIRKYQPDAMIINNTGLSAQGETGHIEIDSVTFERGKPCMVDTSKKPIAGEMCQVLNDHWGYAKNDINYKSVKELVENLVDCRKYNCNYLLNVGLQGNGEIKMIDKGILLEIGKFIKANKDFIYDVKGTNIETDNAFLLEDENDYYVIIKNVGMSADPNVAINCDLKKITIPVMAKKAKWLDNGKRLKIKDNAFYVEPFLYGTSYGVRVAKINK